MDYFVFKKEITVFENLIIAFKAKAETIKT